eukprot:TRINITY_DN32677_c0_g1_i1.p1 TRINITY_DN32677_c0_g1~~TRINITY_DN32677_c0_g1_i1.p1  ORF type:complete len:220 (+),score=33.66 TRINITY_DN32677_c0_g1_i1:26-661(+)
MTSTSGESCECAIQSLDGQAVTLHVQLHWTISVLKDHVEEALAVPCYTQVLSDAGRRLLNTDLLRDVYDAQEQVQDGLTLFLQRSAIPDEYLETDVPRAWEAFRLHSDDCGETISFFKLPDVMRYLGHQEHAATTFIWSSKLCFLDLLDVMATEMDSSQSIEFPDGHAFHEMFYGKNGYDPISLSKIVDVAKAARRTKAAKIRRKLRLISL